MLKYEKLGSLKQFCRKKERGIVVRGAREEYDVKKAKA
jgi:hypothetical protein